MADAGIGVETSDKGSSSSSSTPTPNSNEIEDSSTILIVGDAGCGKSSLIQSFLKPNSNKEPKSTFALEYCFAKRKNASNSDKDGKTLAHIWELGGDIYEPKLLTIPLSTVTLPTSAVIICLDLSKPQDCFLSLKRWLSTIREHLAARFSELRASGQTSQIHAQAMRERALGAYGNSASPHIDANCVKPCEVCFVSVCVMVVRMCSSCHFLPIVSSSFMFIISYHIISYHTNPIVLINCLAPAS